MFIRIFYCLIFLCFWINIEAQTVVKETSENLAQHPVSLLKLELNKGFGSPQNGNNNFFNSNPSQLLPGQKDLQVIGTIGTIACIGGFIAYLAAKDSGQKSAYLTISLSGAAAALIFGSFF